MEGNMNTRRYLMLVVSLLGALVLSACGGGSTSSPASTAAPPSGGAPQGVTVPAEYAGMTNPDAGNATAAQSGKTIFDANCASCHGTDAKGDGPAASSLDPKPKDLVAVQSQLSDAFLFWRISEGGAMKPFNSAMPAWKNSLSQTQIWEVITYIRTLK
jgi:mono/diheme cytochrome c family protein